MVEKSQDKEMDKSVAVGNVENNSENLVYDQYHNIKFTAKGKSKFMVILISCKWK